MDKSTPEQNARIWLANEPNKHNWLELKVWKCLDCEFEGTGEAISYHAIYNMTHRLVIKDGNNS